MLCLHSKQQHEILTYGGNCSHAQSHRGQLSWSLLANDKIRSPHGNIKYDITGVIHHSAILLLKEGGLWVLCESLRSQMQAGILLTMKVIGVNIPYIKRNDVTPLSSSGRLTSSKGSSGLVKVNACIWSLGSVVRGQCSGNNYPG
jgi:hypothetical protein